MKNYLAGVTLFTVIAALPGIAFADVWHCTATPPGLPADQHNGYGYSRHEAAVKAMHRCRASHGECVLQDCHVDHH